MVQTGKTDNHKDKFLYKHGICFLTQFERAIETKGCSKSKDIQTLEKVSLHFSRFIDNSRSLLFFKSFIPFLHAFGINLEDSMEIQFGNLIGLY